MNVLLKLVTVVLVGLAIAACGGGNGDGGDNKGSGDEAAIESLIREFVGAFAEGDADKLADLFSTDCANVEEGIEFALGLLEGAEVSFDVTGVDIQNLESDSAEAAPQGTTRIGDQEQPMGGEGDYSRVVKEGGEWKIADCEFFE